MTDGVVPGSGTREELRAALRSAHQHRDLAGFEQIVEALRRLDPDHPEVHMATAFLLEERGRPAEGASCRIRGYERSLALGGDVAALQPLLHALLQGALDDVAGLRIVRPAALTSSNADVLRTFVVVALQAGSLEDARRGLARLTSTFTEPFRDLEEAVAFAARVGEVVWFAPDGTLVHRADAAPIALHHSTVTQVLVGAAAGRGAATAAFGASLPAALRGLGLWSEASARGSMLHLLTHGHDAAALAFFDRARPGLPSAAAGDLLGSALLSCVRRDAVGAASAYMERLDDVTGCRLAGLTRLASLVGVDAERRPVWAETLRALYGAARGRAEAASAILRETTPWDRTHDFLLARDRPPDGRIEVFLKCVKRPFDIRPFVSFWLECFSDASRYRIRLLDDSGLDLKSAFPEYAIEDSSGLRDGTNPWVDVIQNGRRPVNMLGWESVANLTPFAKARSAWFWNIDADDIRPLLDERTTVESVRTRLRAVERHAEGAGLSMISYDLWASLHYLVEHGYHWTFGICLCRNDPRLLGAMLSSMDAVDIPIFNINIDHMLSRLSDGLLRDGLLSDHIASFVLDEAQVLQLDVSGAELYHRSFGRKKRLDYQAQPGRMIQDFLHAKTLVV